MKTQGIYKIQNTVTRQCYIGSTIDSVKRWREHRYNLNHGRCPNPKLQNAWNKYGEEAFVFKVIDAVPCAGNLLARETLFVRLFDSINHGYNCCAPGSRVVVCQATKEKISASRKGVKFSDAHRAALSASKKGKHYPAALDCLKRAWVTNLGKPRSEETRRKISCGRRARSK